MGSPIKGADAAPLEMFATVIITSTILELLIYPAIHMICKGREFKKRAACAVSGRDSIIPE